MLTIYSRNILGIPVKKLGRRLTGISQQISNLNPDIVMLQEFITGFYLFYFQPQLKKYNFFYLNRSFFTYGGLLIMVKKTIKAKHFKFSQFKDLGPKYNLHLADHLTTRGFQSIYLPKYDLNLINTHILSIYLSRRGYSPIQLEQIEEIRHFLKYQTAACFLTGDFNFSPNTPPYDLLLKDTSLTDASIKLGNSTKLGKNYIRKFDHVLYQKSRIKINSIRYPDDPFFLSDHRAIITSLQINRITKKTDFNNRYPS